MNVQQSIFQKVYKDDVSRTILGHTPFGDILFKEEHDGKETFKALQIYATDHRCDGDHPMRFNTFTIGVDQLEYNYFLKQGDFFKEAPYPEIYQKLFYREGLYEEVSTVVRKSQYQVYLADKDTSSDAPLEDITAMPFQDFCELALKYGHYD